MFLALTSCILLTNAAHAWLKGHIAFSFAFITLVVTSILIHTTDYSDPVFFWIDQFAIYNVLLISILYCFHASLIAVAAAALSLCAVVFLFWGGYALDKFCYDPDIETSQMTHGIMQFIGSAGLHCILLGLPM